MFWQQENWEIMCMCFLKRCTFLCVYVCLIHKVPNAWLYYSHNIDAFWHGPVNEPAAAYVAQCQKLLNLMKNLLEPNKWVRTSKERKQQNVAVNIPFLAHFHFQSMCVISVLADYCQTKPILPFQWLSFSTSARMGIVVQCQTTHQKTWNNTHLMKYFAFSKHLFIEWSSELNIFCFIFKPLFWLSVRRWRSSTFKEFTAPKVIVPAVTGVEMWISF